MDRERLLTFLHEYRAGRADDAEALRFLRDFPYEDLDFAKLDHQRALRQGFPEVVFCPGKTPAQIETICARLLAAGGPGLLATRADEAAAAAVARAAPDAVYHEAARLVTVVRTPRTRPGRVGVVSAGTADVPVAEEAALVAEVLGFQTDRIYDVGVAGLHRLLVHLDRLYAADVLIVVAGMEGALASVVGGLVPGPVVAVPTGVGYGASFGGVTALLAMLNSCAAGLAVVNIDNGFGAAWLAARILSIEN
ncbi:MAG: nickel pincer cofactor biosynthesis protein LarB [Oscillospiraceae bacterium]|jgi:NCAIR mutase (PurE)-related protein|nr:nickel pincer cofactor biosynthesis protein LarB [Oscillospiraceae bacterium]